LVKIDPNKILQFYPANEKILDINESTTAAVTCTISTKVPPNTVAILLMVERMTGAGTFVIYPNEGTQETTLVHLEAASLIAMGNQRLKYKQSAGADSFDLYMFGYFVEGCVKSA